MGPPPPEDWTVSAHELAERSRLRVLIWGPSRGSPLFAKRDEIRLRIRELGHEADFSEDLMDKENVASLGLNISVAELLQVLSYDYVVCLMASIGAVAEVHDFARNKRIAQKMLICVSQDHRDGYSAHGMLRVFEGYNGRIDWYSDPDDLVACALAGRTVDQIRRVSETKQWENAMALMDLGD